MDSFSALLQERIVFLDGSMGALLQSHGLTEADYRKLLIDLKGVKNAWLKALPATIYLDREQWELRGAPPGHPGYDTVTISGRYQVLVDLDDVPTLVFDEVDAGIGGRAGVAVGRRLARLAATRQVLVVTHLPQIAAFADRHIRVEKRAGTASVGALDDGGRIEELTRMLSGLPGSEAAATHAEELIAEAAKAKRSVAGTAR